MYTVSLGHCKPTDCCLCLTWGNKTKQYGIESTAWELLSLYWDVYNQQGRIIPNDVADRIWNDMEADRFPPTDD